MDISSSSVRKKLVELGYSRKKSIKNPILTTKSMQKRVNWCKENRNRDWSKVIFSDESTFEMISNKGEYWSNSRFTYQCAKHPTKQIV